MKLTLKVEGDGEGCRETFFDENSFSMGRLGQLPIASVRVQASLHR